MTEIRILSSEHWELAVKIDNKLVGKIYQLHTLPHLWRFISIFILSWYLKSLILWLVNNEIPTFWMFHIEIPKKMKFSRGRGASSVAGNTTHFIIFGLYFIVIITKMIGDHHHTQYHHDNKFVTAIIFIKRSWKQSLSYHVLPCIGQISEKQNGSVSGEKRPKIRGQGGLVKDHTFLCEPFPKDTHVRFLLCINHQGYI